MNKTDPKNKFEAELKSLLAQATDNDPVWRAVMLLLDQEIVIKTDSVCNPTDMMANFQRGELTSLRDFKARLVALHPLPQNGVK